jgi:type IV secretion system protein VirB11
VTRLVEGAIAAKANILVVGGTGSGKTTFANALLQAIAEHHPAHRIVGIEDTPELQYPVENFVSLRTSYNVDMPRLLRATMRLRPDRIVIGEVRGGEAFSLLKAWNSGHPGGFGTIHADSAEEGLGSSCSTSTKRPKRAHCHPRLSAARSLRPLAWSSSSKRLVPHQVVR